jgi:metal-dependent amidase/aminoacylase/carboxypeptidase family protein
MSESGTSPTDQVLAGLGRLLPDIEALYKDVHAHPELSMQELRTSELAATSSQSATIHFFSPTVHATSPLCFSCDSLRSRNDS